MLFRSLLHKYFFIWHDLCYCNIHAKKTVVISVIAYKNDKDGNIGLSFGKKSFSDDNLIKNFNTVLDTLEKEKSNLTIKGDLIRNIFVTSTMGVAYKVKLGKNF